MPGLAPEVKALLQERFGPRVNFEERERRIYANDMGVMPSMVKPLVGNPVPDGIVQPVSEEELVWLVGLAHERGIPLTPRGKGTSGYGGVLPVDGGLVVEFNRMNRILSVDADSRTATVEPGAVWQEVEYHLNRQQLTLALYPTSFPSSSVGGWLAQGGAGIGSYEYGFFRDNVVSARVVQMDGEAKDFSGRDLDLVSDANGVSGFISRVTFRVKPVKPMHVRVVAFDTAAGLSAFLASLFDRRVLMWSVSFINPQAANLRNQLPPRLHHGHPVHDVPHVVLPEKFLVTLACTTDRCDLVEPEVMDLVRRHGGELLSEDIARHEWEMRFSPMRIKRIAPSLIPSEVVVPVDRVGAVIEEIGRDIKHPFVLEGFAVAGRQVVLLGFILHDERRFNFNMAFGLALTTVRVAQRHGGRPYATGLYFSGFAPDILGRERLERLREFTQATDPRRLLNPGKVLETRLVAGGLGIASAFEPLVRVFGNWAQSKPPGEVFTDTRGLPGDIAWYAYACSQCGYCVEHCDQYYGRGWLSQSPRGKWTFLKMVLEGEDRFDQQAVNTFLACTTCEMCNHTCDLGMPIEPSWMKLRGLLVDGMGFHTFPPFEIMVNTSRRQGNIWGGYRRDRAQWLTDEFRPDIVERSDYAFFVGCTSSYVEHDLARSAAFLLQKAGISYAYLGDREQCCGIPMLCAGRWEVFDELAAHNIAQMKSTGATTVITTCPACWLVWEVYYRKWAGERNIDYPFQVKHYAQLLAERIQAGQFSFTHDIGRQCTYHDPCHMGRAGHVFEEPRTLLRAIPGANFREMRFHHEDAHCCGAVISLVADPDIAARVGAVRLQEAVECGADTVVTACPCCRVQLKLSCDKAGLPLQVRDLATLAAEALGRPEPSSDAVMDERWAVFDAMIRMMTPWGMAEMMATMIPEMIEAMPDTYRAMMKAVIASPAALREPMLAAMKGVMPSLFPVLLPGMMPRIMPTMLEKVKAAIPMPAYLQEQMPDLMPRAMEVLMPKMLPEIIPYFLPRMLDYLRTAAQQA